MKIIGSEIRRLTECSSTMSWFETNRMLRLQDGFVLQAEFQKAGQGNANSTWHSQKGKNLLFSMYIEPRKLEAARVFLISQFVSLGILNYLQAYQIKDLSIKWPNDIYIADKKIAGILIRNELDYQYIQSSVIGVGLNLNQVVFPDELPNPTSLKLELNRSWDLSSELEKLLHFVDFEYQKLNQKEYHSIEEDYTSFLYLKNKSHEFTLPDGSLINGVIRGVNEFGHLELETEKGLQYFAFKEIIF